MKKFLNWLKNNWLLVLIVAIGGLLRFYRLQDLSTFGGDQGIDYQNVAKMIVEKRLSLLGPVTHVGIFLGPLYYYLLIPFFLIFKFDPIAAPVMFALFGTATVGLVYVLAKLLLRPDLAGQGLAFVDTLAFLASLLYAVSPVILESSRAPSQPHLIPFFVTLLLISIIHIFRKTDKWWDWVAIGICLGSLIQLHFLTFPIYIFFIIIILKLVTSRKLERSFILPTAYCLLFTILLLFPWFLFELRHNFFITNQIFNYLRSGEVSFSASGYFERVLDLIWFSFDRLIGQGNQAVTAGAIILSIVGVVSTALPVFSIFLFYFWLNIFGIALYRFPLSNHYISALYPIIILFFSIGLFQRISNLPVFTLRSRALLCRVTFILFTIFAFSHNNLNSNHGYTMPEWVNTSFINRAADIISQDFKKQTGTYNIVNTLDGDTRANPYRYVLTYKISIAPLGVEKYSEGNHLYIISRNTTNELLDDKRWELLSFPVGSIEELGTVGGDIKMYRWDNGEADRKDLKR